MSWSWSPVEDAVGLDAIVPVEVAVVGEETDDEELGDKLEDVEAVAIVADELNVELAMTDDKINLVRRVNKSVYLISGSRFVARP